VGENASPPCYQNTRPMNTFHKLKWITGILLIFIIVLTTNLVDRSNFQKLKQSVTSIYEDRIVANDLIFELSLLVQEKEIAVAREDSVFFRRDNGQVNQDIQGLLQRYRQTRLTRQEKTIFRALQEQLETINQEENEYIASGYTRIEGLLKAINATVHTLSNLSKVQLNEGKRQMEISKNTMKTIDLFTRIEIIFLVISAIMVQIIILYKPAKD
jgi:hypothetical protein